MKLMLSHFEYTWSSSGLFSCNSLQGADINTTSTIYCRDAFTRGPCKSTRSLVHYPNHNFEQGCKGPCFHTSWRRIRSQRSTTIRHDEWEPVQEGPKAWPRMPGWRCGSRRSQTRAGHHCEWLVETQSRGKWGMLGHGRQWYQSCR